MLLSLWRWWPPDKEAKHSRPLFIKHSVITWMMRTKTSSFRNGTWKMPANNSSFKKGPWMMPTKTRTFKNGTWVMPIKTSSFKNGTQLKIYLTWNLLDACKGFLEDGSQKKALNSTYLKEKFHLMPCL